MIKETFLKLNKIHIEAYAEEVRKANLEELTHPIKVCGFLTQRKISSSGKIIEKY